MIAMRAIGRSGLRLKEDLFLGASGQETWAPPGAADEIAGRSGVGPAASQVREGHGARWLVEHGVVADYALVGEVSDFRVTVAQAGYLRLRIAVPGHLPYTPGLRRGDGPAGSPNPFERAARVVLALEDWARRYETGGAETFHGGTLVPKAQVLEMRPAGPPWTEPQDRCHIFFDVRLMPGAHPPAVRQQVRDAIAATGIAAQVTAYDFKRGYIAEGAEPLLDALGAAHEEIVGGALDYRHEQPGDAGLRGTGPGGGEILDRRMLSRSHGNTARPHGILPGPETHRAAMDRTADQHRHRRDQDTCKDRQPSRKDLRQNGRRSRSHR